MERTVKVVGKHRKGCGAIKNEKSGVWDTCWGPTAWGNHGEPIIHTKRRCGKNGTRVRSWLRYVCNDTQCKAELHVDVDAIAAIANIRIGTLCTDKKPSQAKKRKVRVKEALR